MVNMIICQNFLKKEEGKSSFNKYLGVSEILTPYTKEVYEGLNEMLIKCKISKEVSEMDILLISEVVLIFVLKEENIKELGKESINLENTNEEEEIYLSIDEFVKDVELINNISNIKFNVVSQIEQEFWSEEIDLMINLFQGLVKNDFVNYLKSKNIIIKFAK